MSRRMARSAAVGIADNTGSLVFTVPAGHKYEVLTVAIQHTAAAAANLLGLATTTFNCQVLLALAGEANRSCNVFEYNALCFEAGDSLTLFAFATGATWRYHVTYVDVTTI